MPDPNQGKKDPLKVLSDDEVREVVPVSERSVTEAFRSGCAERDELEAFGHQQTDVNHKLRYQS